jgi:zona occludens toxin
MLVLNEGVPGAGKSYDAVVTHILPALQTGRPVYARVNGLNHEKIATYLDMPVENVRALLHHLTPEVVRSMCRIESSLDDDGNLKEEFKCDVPVDALIVIDEAHDFWVASRNPLPKEQEVFFAEHRHRGWDIVLMSQWYKRLHSALRARIERKDVFTKLSAVGADSAYQVRHFTTIGPDRFEATGTETRRYNKDIFPLYSSVVAGTKNMAVYTAGRTTIWRGILKHAIWMVPLGLIAIWYVVGFFHGDHGFGKKPAVVATDSKTAGKGDTLAQKTSTSGAQQHEEKYKTEGMPADVAYVFQLANQSRPRLSATAVVQATGRTYGYVEFVESQSHIIERLTLDQIRDLGIQYQPKSYGLRMWWKDQTIIVTAWPLDTVGRISDSQNAEIAAHPVRSQDQQMIGGVPSVASLAANPSARSSSSGSGANQRDLHAKFDASFDRPRSSGE